MELCSISGYKVHIPGVHAYLVSDDLGKGGEVALPLGPNSGRHADLSARLDSDPCAFIGSDAGGFGESDNTNPYMAPFSFIAWFVNFYKLFIPDKFNSFFIGVYRLCFNGSIR